MVNKHTFWKFSTCILDHQDSEFSSENEDDFPTKSTAKTTSKKTGNSSKPEVAKSSISASGIFDDQDQKHDTAEGNSLKGIAKKTVRWEVVQFVYLCSLLRNTLFIRNIMFWNGSLSYM